MNVVPIKTRLFEEGEDLAAFIRAHVEKLKEGSVLVVTSKIVALAEGRTVLAATEAEKDRVIQGESEMAKKTKWVWVTVKDDMLMPNAGVDASNAGEKLVLLPKDSFAAAAKLRTALRRAYGIRKLGVLITDSRTYPMRSGVTGVALGYAGFKGIRDYRGKKDLFGRPFKFSQTNVADGLASAAVVVMGEGTERQPLALITEAPVAWTEKPDRTALSIPFEDDMYLPFLGSLAGKAGKRK
jgi:coenzyme F420-0:L-glutamate ligase